ncbi:MAG: RluA family pseudouridine synthase [Myxococcota bacterium]|nr:RluA family pseudouridine synthase [Myxococcota bacterium]
MTDEQPQAKGRADAIAAQFIVDGNEARMRLDQYLSTKIKRLSRNRVHRFILRGDVECNGKPVSPSQRVRPGDTVLLWRVPPPEPLAGGWPEEICRGRDWVALNKPGDLTVHPTARYFHQTVTAWMDLQDEGFDDARLVHRLDRETSGVLLIALGLPADRRLGLAFERKQMRKEYLAIVEGSAPREAICDGAIGDLPEPGIIRLKQGVIEGGAEALTRVTLVRHLPSQRSLVRCFPLSGRMHQIRVHLAHLGHPILGDKIYGSAPDEAYDRFCDDGISPDLLTLFGAPRHLLHAASLEFPDPEVGRRRVEAALPDDFLALLD